MTSIFNHKDSGPSQNEWSFPHSGYIHPSMWAGLQFPQPQEQVTSSDVIGEWKERKIIYSGSKGLQFQKVRPWLSLWEHGSNAGRHGAGTIAESLHLILRHEEEKRKISSIMYFLTLKPTPSDIPPLTRPCLLILPTVHQLGTKHEPMGAMLIQTITLDVVRCLVMHQKPTEQMDRPHVPWLLRLLESATHGLKTSTFRFQKCYISPIYVWLPSFGETTLSPLSSSH